VPYQSDPVLADLMNVLAKLEEHGEGGSLCARHLSFAIDARLTMLLEQAQQ